MVLKTVGLTGASGMVGRHVLAALAARGIHCAATSRSRPKQFEKTVAWRAWDLRDQRSAAEMDALFGAVDVFFHVGAAVPSPHLEIPDSDFLSANVAATRAIGIWALERGIPLIFLSGGIVYGADCSRPISESCPRSITPEGGFYGLTKVLAEIVLENLLPSGLKLCVLRPSSIYGIGLAANKTIPAFMATAARGEAIHLRPPVEDSINLIHASDIARAMLAAAEREALGTFNIAADRLTTLLELARTIATVCGRGSDMVVTGQEPARPAIDRFPLDCSKALAELGFRADVSLTDGLMRLRKGLY